MSLAPKYTRIHTHIYLYVCPCVRALFTYTSRSIRPLAIEMLKRRCAAAVTPLLPRCQAKVVLEF